MLQITIVCIGKIKESYLKEGLAEYLKRLGPLAKMSVCELAEEKAPANPSLAQIQELKEAEGRRILAALPKDCYHIILDLGGKDLSSEQLASKMAELALMGKSHLVFTIGGSCGLGRNVVAVADYSLSFGRKTYPHQLMRLILAEQLYRACKINAGQTYHK